MYYLRQIILKCYRIICTVRKTFPVFLKRSALLPKPAPHRVPLLKRKFLRQRNYADWPKISVFRFPGIRKTVIFLADALHESGFAAAKICRASFYYTGEAPKTVHAFNDLSQAGSPELPSPFPFLCFADRQDPDKVHLMGYVNGKTCHNLDWWQKQVMKSLKNAQIDGPFVRNIFVREF